MKLDLSYFAFMSNNDYRVLMGIEIGMKNHEYVPTSLISSLSNLRREGINRVLRTLLQNKLIVHKNVKYDGYKLTYLGYDYLALKAFAKRGSVKSVGMQIGVGKESDIFICKDNNGELKCLKIHRLGRVSFRTIKNKRDYFGKKTFRNWLYLSKIAATKEYAYLKALYENDFPVPIPYDLNRHMIVMAYINGFPLAVVKLRHPTKVIDDLINTLLKFAKADIIHGDFNEFNILIDDNEKVTIIDFPQIVSLQHENAQMYFDRDMKCIIEYFYKKYRIDIVNYPTYEDVISMNNQQLIKCSEHITQKEDSMLLSVLQRDNSDYELDEEFDKKGNKGADDEDKDGDDTGGHGHGCYVNGQEKLSDDEDEFNSCNESIENDSKEQYEEEESPIPLKKHVKEKKGKRQPKFENEEEVEEEEEELGAEEEGVEEEGEEEEIEVEEGEEYEYEEEEEEEEAGEEKGIEIEEGEEYEYEYEEEEEEKDEEEGSEGENTAGTLRGEVIEKEVTEYEEIRSTQVNTNSSKETSQSGRRTLIGKYKDESMKREDTKEEMKKEKQQEKNHLERNFKMSVEKGLKKAQVDEEHQNEGRLSTKTDTPIRESKLTEDVLKRHDNEDGNLSMNLDLDYVDESEGRYRGGGSSEAENNSGGNEYEENENSRNEEMEIKAKELLSDETIQLKKSNIYDSIVNNCVNVGYGNIADNVSNCSEQTDFSGEEGSDEKEDGQEDEQEDDTDEFEREDKEKEQEKGNVENDKDDTASVESHYSSCNSDGSEEGKIPQKLSGTWTPHIRKFTKEYVHNKIKYMNKKKSCKEKYKNSLKTKTKNAAMEKIKNYI